MSYQRYKTSKVLIDDKLLEGIYSMEIPSFQRPIFEDPYDIPYDMYEKWLRIECINQKYPNFEPFFKNIEIKVIHEKVSKLYIGQLVEVRIEHEFRNGIFKSELDFHILEVHEGSKCPFCKNYGMELEDLNKDGIVYNICKLCGKTWYEWDDLNDKLDGKNIFKDMP